MNLFDSIAQPGHRSQSGPVALYPAGQRLQGAAGGVAVGKAAVQQSVDDAILRLATTHVKVVQLQHGAEALQRLTQLVSEGRADKLDGDGGIGLPGQPGFGDLSDAKNIIRISDVSGRQLAVIENVSFTKNNITKVDFRTYEKGVYFVTVFDISGEIKSVFKVIKE